jgi:hypothetical protein
LGGGGTLISTNGYKVKKLPLLSEIYLYGADSTGFQVAVWLKPAGFGGNCKTIFYLQIK